jgi:hypothetical protein
MTTPADELRAAADAVEMLARAASQGPWRRIGYGDNGWTVSLGGTDMIETDDSEIGKGNATWIEAMQPDAGRRLAPVLRWAADHGDAPAALLAIARAILQTSRRDHWGDEPTLRP